MKIRQRIFFWLAWSVVPGLLYLAARYDYLFFHILGELFSILTAFSIFVIVLNARKLLTHPYLFFVGAGYFFVGALDLLHALSFPGMPFFKEFAFCDSQFWIAARYLESFSFLAGFLFLARRKPSFYALMGFFSLIFILTLLSVLVWKVFPVCYRVETGLTAFKIYSEYAIMVILLTVLLLFYRFRHRFETRILRLLSFAVLSTMAAEFFLTLYSHPYDLSNLMGHGFKILSFFLIYRAVLIKGLSEPFHELVQNLRQSEKRFKELSELLPLSVFETDAEGRIIYENRIMRLITGHDPEKNPVLIHEILNCIKAPDFFNTPIYGEEFNLIQNHHSLPVLLYTSLIKKQGEPLGVRGCFLDISTQKSIEERLKESNERLSAFAHSVAHDLRAPLTTVKGFCLLLKSKIQPCMDADGEKYFSTILQTLSRSEQMIRGLLDYAETTHFMLSRQKVLLEKEMAGILESLAALIQESGAEIRVNPLPAVTGYPTHLARLFQNLLENALKFRDQTRNPVIEISGHVNDNQREAVFQVKDNGIGMAPENRDRIFEIFHRLHASGSYPGAGIGLAACKKIVENHGGRIWVESKPGEGSVFFFTLPL